MTVHKTTVRRAIRVGAALMGTCFLVGLTGAAGCVTGQRTRAQCPYRAELRAGQRPRTASCLALWRLRVEALLAQGRRGEAVEGLRQSRHDPEAQRALAVAVVRWGLRQPQRAVRVAAIHAVRLGEMEPLRPELAQLLGDEFQLVQVWAAMALPELDEAGALLYRLSRTGVTAARVVATRGLGNLFGAASIPALRERVQDQEAVVRQAAVTGLAATRSSQACEPLQALLRDTDAAVRAGALQGLAALGQCRACDGALQLVRQPDEQVQAAAIQILGGCGDGKARDALQHLVTSTSPRLALLAAARLAARGDGQPLGRLSRRALDSDSAELRMEALRQASGLATGQRAELARRGLQDAEPRVRLAAAELLLGSGKERAAALAALAALERQSCAPAQPADERLCLDVARTMARQTAPRGLEQLKQLVRQARDFTTRTAALHALLEREPAVETALAALADPDARVALAAARWLFEHHR